MTETDSRRNARLLALMAANAFVLIQIYEHHIDFVNQAKANKMTAVGLSLIAVISLLGLGAGYVSLCLKPKTKQARWTEMFSAGSMTAIVGWYVVKLVANVIF